MASASSLLSEEQFLCSICLDVFTEPVTIPCGHNFCKACITKYWDNTDQCHCPMCKNPLKTRPNLFVNTLISEMAAEFRKSVDVKAANCKSQNQEEVEVPCDVCHGTKHKALKSCLVCLASYCESHLEPHQRVAALKRHKLIDPVENLEHRICKKHDKFLELFCRSDQICVCVMCTEHKSHDTVPLEEEYEERKAQLGKKKAEVQEMIQERRQKVQEIKHSVELNKEDTEKEISESVEVFTALMASIQRNQAELIEVIEEKQRATEKQAEGFITELEQEITELQRRSTELERLSHTEDHLHLLLSFPSLSSAPHTKYCSYVSVHRHLCAGKVRQAVDQLEEVLAKQMETLLKQMKMIKEDLENMPEDVRLRRIQQLYAVDVTLDPDTAHPRLILSEDRKQVRDSDTRQNLPDNPERFDVIIDVLGKEGFSSGRFYYEVQVKGVDWDLGVVKESVNRKGTNSTSPNNGYWVIWLRDGTKYSALDHPIMSISVRANLEKVGVFVDYEEGLVSFYDVKNRALIYSFTDCTFTEKIYPYFSASSYVDDDDDDVDRNYDSLIITPSLAFTTDSETKAKKKRREYEGEGGATQFHRNETERYSSLEQKGSTFYIKRDNIHIYSDMASASSLLSEEQFLCSICLDVFIEPVSIPCGHNFCKACITKYWDNTDQCHCPMCKNPLEKRPNLFVNTLISEMAAEFRKSVDVKAANCKSQNQEEVEVPCDVCHGTKHKALKSCLVCLASYCESHLEPHQRVVALKRHKLINPVENLEDRICKKHDKFLELFCRSDQICVCVMCTEHKTHDTVPLEEEYEERKAQLGKKKAEVQEMIQERRQKVQEIKHSVELNKEDTEKEISESVEVFTALMASIQRNQAELIEVIEEKQRATEKQAEGFITELEQEITELQRRSTELERLSHTEDHLHLLLSFPSLSSAPHTKYWSYVSVHRHLCAGKVRQAVDQLEEVLAKQMETLLKQMTIIKEDLENMPEDVRLRRIQQLYAVDVTLDPDTAHPELILSEDRKQVIGSDTCQNLPDNPERFDTFRDVLGKEGFSSGRFYYEVQVKGVQWDLGVVRESVNRKGTNVIGPNNGYWVIWLRDGTEYSAVNGFGMSISVRENLEKVGVFVDYEEGLVSLYDVKNRALIYSFTDCTFTEEIYPYFSPSSYNDDDDDDDDDDVDGNYDPLIITPVKHTE
ncbi:uncharacterized protein ACJ7VT_015194 [Polymixia lowei]